MSDEMDEIWALYADDGAQALDAMETSLLALQAGEDPSTHVGALFRAVHTFKGNSRVLGLAVVESRAHLSEDLIGLVRDEGVPMDAEIVDILLLGSDTLRDMLETTAATHADVDPASSEELMRRLADKIARCKGGAAEASAAPEAPEAQPAVAAVPEAPAVVAVSPPPAPEPPPAPAAAPAAAPAPKRLADDPVYREIFRGMAEGARNTLRTQLAQFDADAGAATLAARREADGLCHAARQMGLDGWAATLSAYLAGPDEGAEGLAALVLRLDELSEADSVAEDPVPGDQPALFDAIAGPLNRIAGFGVAHAAGQPPTAEAVAQEVEALRAAVAPQGYVRVIEALDQLVRAADAAAFQIAELRLYEELAGVEAMMPEAAAAAGISPRRMLESWSAGHVFETLASLGKVLNALRTGEDSDAGFRRFDRLMRLVHHACQHHRVETAAQLSMSLVDLFSRVQASGMAPDGILTHIARGFIDTIELVFDALAQGATPATEVLDRLFEEASNICFVSDGLMTAKTIERRLGLPEDFHRVLSPESVRAASLALEQGMRFYIIRTDINNDTPIAEAFLEWLSGDSARSITNVTVFRGTDTLFDFLIATRLDEADVTEALAGMDPAGGKLKILRALTPLTEGSAEPAAPTDAPLGQGATVTPEMLDSIGEISASQAMVHHMLVQLAETDLADEVESVMRQSGGSWESGRERVREFLTGFGARVQQMAQAEASLTAQLAQLQEETVALRSRPANTVLRPLQTFVETQSRRNHREAKMTTAGGELALDLTLLERLRSVLRSLVSLRLDRAEGAPRVLHVTLRRDEERVMVILQDDGAPQAETPALADLHATLRRMNGSLRAVPVPGGGVRFHLGLPLAMVVLEGMVVGVDGVRYVLPVDAIRTILQLDGSAVMKVSAAQGQRLIRISDTEIVAVHSLKGHPSEGSQSRPWPSRRRVYVILNANGNSVAIPVDELLGQQLVLLRPLKGVLTRLRHLTGLALLAGGDVGMVLSANRICDPANSEPYDTSLRM